MDIVDIILETRVSNIVDFITSRIHPPNGGFVDLASRFTCQQPHWEWLSLAFGLTWFCFHKCSNDPISPGGIKDERKSVVGAGKRTRIYWTISWRLSVRSLRSTSANSIQRIFKFNSLDVFVQGNHKHEPRRESSSPDQTRKSWSRWYFGTVTTTTSSVL